jgi:hypothetical protein
MNIFQRQFCLQCYQRHVIKCLLKLWVWDMLFRLHFFVKKLLRSNCGKQWSTSNAGKMQLRYRKLRALALLLKGLLDEMYLVF